MMKLSMYMCKRVRMIRLPPPPSPLPPAGVPGARGEGVAGIWPPVE